MYLSKGVFMNTKISRRSFIKSGIGAGTAAIFSGGKKGSGMQRTGMQRNKGKMVVISSANGQRATEKAMQLLREGLDPLDAVIAGVNIIESDPEDITVGYGGLPNEDGVVELDASVMHGPTHNGVRLPVSEI